MNTTKLTVSEMDMRHMFEKKYGGWYGMHLLARDWEFEEHQYALPDTKQAWFVWQAAFSCALDVANRVGGTK